MAARADVGGIRYAMRHYVQYVYWDVNTGEIMQFLTTWKWKTAFDKVDGMFPDREMKLTTIDEYINYFKKK